MRSSMPRLLRLVPITAIIVLLCSGCFDPDLGLNGAAADADTTADEGSGDIGSTDDHGGGDEPQSTEQEPSTEDGAPADDTSADDGADTPTVTDETDGVGDGDAVTSGAGPDGTASCSGVTVKPGDNVGRTLSGKAEGTTFCFAAGTYKLRGTLVPKARQRLIATGEAIFDGGHAVEDGIRGHRGYQDGVTIQGFEIRNYNGDGIETADNWIVRDNVIHDANVGVRLKKGSQALSNLLTKNRRYGVFATGDGKTAGKAIVLDGNEISFNNTAGYDEGDQGGTKLIKVDGLQVRRNWVHDNDGNGLWTDADNINVVYEDNVVEDNDGIGIFHEISYKAVIRNNVVRNNRGAGSKTLWYGSQLHVQNSQDVEIYGNTVAGPSNGIGIVGSTKRGSGLYGTYRAADITVHGNTVATDGTSGAVGESYVTSSGIRFSDNTYRVGDGGSHWVWGSGATLSWSRWQSAGHDRDGERIIE